MPERNRRAQRYTSVLENAKANWSVELGKKQIITFKRGEPRVYAVSYTKAMPAERECKRPELAMSRCWN